MTEYNNQQQHLQNDENENGSGLTLHDLLQMVLANWYWFALSVLICLGMAYYYLASTPKIYSRTATILVKDSRKGGDMELGAFSDLVGFQNRRNVDNEVYILQSHRLMSEVVKRLHLTVNYSVRAADARPLRPLAHRSRFHRRRQPAPFARGDRARGRPDQTGGLRRQVPHQAGEAQGHPRPVRRYDPHTAGADGRTQDAVHGLDLCGQAHHRDQELADGHDERLPRHREERRGQQAGVDRHHLDEQFRTQACRGRDQHADRRVRRGRHRRQAAGIGRDQRLHQGAYAGHRTGTGRRGQRNRGDQEEQPDDRHHLGGYPIHHREQQIQGRRAFDRKPDQRRQLHPRLPQQPDACGGTDPDGRLADQQRDRRPDHRI